MQWQDKIINAHKAVTDSVSHYKRMKSDRYLVWQEEKLKFLNANDSSTELKVYGTTDLFTKTEFDGWIRQLCTAFDDYGIAYRCECVGYEEETEYIHYQWEWSVTDG